MPYARQYAGGNRRRQRGCENKARCKGANAIHDIRARSDVTAHHAKGLCERSLDDVDALHGSIARGNAGTARTVKSDAVNFVQIGKRAIPLREITNVRNRSEIT